MTGFHAPISNKPCALCNLPRPHIAHNGARGDSHPWHLNCIVPLLANSDTCPHCPTTLDRTFFWKERFLGEINWESKEFLASFICALVRNKDPAFAIPSIMVASGLMGAKALMLKGVGRVAAVAVIALSLAIMGEVFGSVYGAPPLSAGAIMGIGTLVAAMIRLDETSIPPAVLIGSLIAVLGSNLPT